MRFFDHIVVGHGLAGLALEFELTRRGHHVLVIDAEDASASSRVAAGLVTPITGKRFTVLPDYDRLFDEASQFYESLGSPLLRRPALRLFVDAEERARFVARRASLATHLAADDEAHALARDHGWLDEHGGCLMPYAARLEIRKASALRRAALGSRYLNARVDVAALTCRDSAVQIDALDVAARHLSFCDGALGRGNPWLGDLRFTPAKGEILVVDFDAADIDVTLHARGLWLTRDDTPTTYRLGATFEPEVLDTQPTNAARTAMVDAMQSVVGRAFVVREHHAALRPILVNRRPAAGLLAAQPRIGWINGLGARGALLAPNMARQYCDAIEARP